jgi:hypothetical protein
MSLGIPQNLLQQSLAMVPAAFEAPTRGAQLQAAETQARLQQEQAEQQLQQLQQPQAEAIDPQLLQQARAVEDVFLSSIKGGRPELGKAVFDAFLEANPQVADQMIQLGELDIPEEQKTILIKGKDPETGQIVTSVVDKTTGEEVTRGTLGLLPIGAKTEAEQQKQLQMKEKAAEISAKVEVKKQEEIRTAKKRELLADVKKNIDLLNDLEPDIPTFGRVGGAIERAKALAGVSPVVQTLNNLSGVLVTQIAKKVAGETGRLTNEDIDRARGIVYSPLDTKQERLLKKATLRLLLNPDITGNEARSLMDEALTGLAIEPPVQDAKEIVDIQGESFEIVRDETGKPIGRRRVR